MNTNQPARCRTGISRRTVLQAAAGAVLARPAIAQPARIVYWTPQDPNSRALPSQGERAMLDLFRKRHPDITLDVQAVPWQVMGQQVIQAVMGGGGPDVVQLSTTELADQVAAGTTRALDDYVGKGW